MSEEQKAISVVGKPPMLLAQRVERMSWKNLEGEVNRFSKGKKDLEGKKHKPSLEDGMLADILLLTLFHKNNRGNDPYVLDHKSHSKAQALDLHRGKK